MAKKPLITTIIPTYQRPHLLKRALQSALNQTFTNIEILVFDNASQDETQELVETMAQQDSRIQFHGSKQLLSATANFQRGLNHVETPYFSILADDDILLPDFYMTALNTLHRHPDSFFFMGATIDIDEQGNTIYNSAAHWPDVEYFSPPSGVYEILRHYVNWTGSLFRREIAQTLPIDPEVKAIDFDFVLRAGLHYPFSFSKTPCALFVQHSRSYSSCCGSKLVWPSSLKTLQNLIANTSLPPAVTSKIEFLMLHYLRNTLFRIALRSLCKQELEEANKIAKIFQEELKEIKTFYLMKALLIFAQKNLFVSILKNLSYLWIARKRRHYQKNTSNLSRYLLYPSYTQESPKIEPRATSKPRA